MVFRRARGPAQLGIAPLHPSVVHIAFPVEQGQDVVDPSLTGLRRVLGKTARPRHLFLAVVLRHPPVVQLPHLPAIGVEDLPRFLSGFMDSLGAPSFASTLPVSSPRSSRTR